MPASSVQMGEVSLEKVEVYFFLRKTKLQFFKISFAHLHTAPYQHTHVGHITLQCVSADRVHTARKTRSMSPPCDVQINKVQFRKKWSSTFTRKVDC